MAEGSNNHQAADEPSARARLLDMIGLVVSAFSEEAEPHPLFDNLLACLLSATESECGFIGEVMRTSDGTPWLRTHAITNIAWDEESRRMYERYATQGLEFTNLNTLFGEVITSGKPVIANNPATDPRSSGLPTGHPPMERFLGVPLYYRGELVGVVGVANRELDYDKKLIEFMQPLASTSAMLVGTYRGVCARRRAEAALREAERRFRTMTDQAPVMVWMSGSGGLRTWFNKMWLNVTGNTLDTEMGHGWAEGIHPADREGCLGACAAAFETRTSFETTYRLRGAGGGYRWILDRGVPRFRDDGEFVGFIGSAVDITEGKQAEQRQQELIAELSRKNTELEEFAYTISHDLKTPLVAVTGYMDLLLGDLNEGNLADVREYAAGAATAAKEMLHSIEHLLHYACIGGLVNPSEQVRLDEVVGEVLHVVADQVEQRKVQVHVAPNLPVVKGDRVRLREAFQNLIGNALKYLGNQPEPRIEVGMQEANEEPAFFVRDNGVGIDPKNHDKVFGVFEKLDPGSAGVGVGLAIVKRVIELHGGRVWVESEGAGKGSAFLFTLPRVSPLARQASE